jgi:hypothetical protein
VTRVWFGAEQADLQRLHLAEHRIDLRIRHVVVDRVDVREEVQPGIVELLADLAEAVERQVDAPLRAVPRASSGNRASSDPGPDRSGRVGHLRRRLAADVDQLDVRGADRQAVLDDDVDLILAGDVRQRIERAGDEPELSRLCRSNPPCRPQRARERRTAPSAAMAERLFNMYTSVHNNPLEKQLRGELHLPRR